MKSDTPDTSRELRKLIADAVQDYGDYRENTVQGYDARLPDFMTEIVDEITDVVSDYIKTNVPEKRESDYESYDDGYNDGVREAITKLQEGLQR